MPTWRLSHGIASPWIVPSKREPITRSSPAARRSTNGASSRDRVRRVGVAHHEVVATGMGQPGEVGAAVARPLLADDGRAVLGGDLGGAVGRGVVDHDHLAGAARAADALPGLVDDDADRLLLVEARDHDRDLRGHRRKLRVGCGGDGPAGAPGADGTLVQRSPSGRSSTVPAVVTRPEVDR